MTREDDAYENTWYLILKWLGLSTPTSVALPALRRLPSFTPRPHAQRTGVVGGFCRENTSASDPAFTLPEERVDGDGGVFDEQEKL